MQLHIMIARKDEVRCHALPFCGITNIEPPRPMLRV